IVWGCLATVFACTWVSVHPNLPPPNQSWLALFWRRLKIVSRRQTLQQFMISLKMMLIAVIAPELMVGFAARQFFFARWFSREYGVSRTHGFFFSMGGFVSRSGHRPIVTKKQIRDLPEYLTEICSVDAEDIQDKSKGDALSKGVAMIQGLWFTIQCLARVQQHLPVTNLEVATLAFAVVNVFIWILWWNKPLDVQRPILPSLKAGSEKLLEGNGMPRRGGLSDVVGALIGLYDDFKPTTQVSVPSFWSSDLAGQEKVGHSFLIECFVGTLFGAVHCAVWNTEFPSTDEMWMWRSSALFVSAIPVAFALATMAVTRRDMDSVVGVASSIVVFVLPIPIYIIARVFLIVVALIAFRALPPAALTDVNWSIYIPHL
ncbi:hypothetical protein K438DRAFT_1463551, partial [Mycena galopus ATCC 62051]